MSLEDIVITVAALAVSFFVARPLFGGGDDRNGGGS